MVPEHVGAVPPALARTLPPDDERIRIALVPPDTRANSALNAAVAAPGADYVALIDPGDSLTDDALLRVVEWIDRSTADVLYSDERVDGSIWHSRLPVTTRKPAWSPEHALTEPYVGRLCVYRRARVLEVGGFDESFDDAREHDLLLRLCDAAARVTHVPAVLYRRAEPESSTRVARRSAELARAIAARLRRVNADADVVAASAAVPLRVRFRLRGNPTVSIVIPTVGTTVRVVGGRTIDLLANTIQSIAERTAYRAFEIVYVHDRPLRRDTLDAIAAADVPVRAIAYDRSFNWSEKMNLGASIATGEHLLALNDDIEVADGEWLGAMLEYSQQAEVGAVGAKLLFPDGAIQHVGVVLQDGAPLHPYHGCSPARQIGIADLDGVRNYSAVTGACLMTRARVFREAGGFSPEFAVNYNDLEYCLRVRARGYRVVFTPYARLYHLESVSRAHAGSAGVEAEELARLARRWPDVRARDPYHDPRRRSVSLW